MSKLSMADILKMSAAERIILVEDIWDSIATAPDAVSLTPDQREELDRRLDAFHKNPQAGAPWAEVKARIGRT